MTSLSRISSRAYLSWWRRSYHFESFSLICCCKTCICYSFESISFCINSGSWELGPFEISSRFILMLVVLVIAFICEQRCASFGSFWVPFSWTSVESLSSLSSLICSFYLSIVMYWIFASLILQCFLSQWMLQTVLFIMAHSLQIVHWRSVPLFFYVLSIN